MSQFDAFEDSEKLKADAAARKLQREQDAADLRKIASSSEGQRFLTRLFEQATVHCTSFNVDPTVAAFNEGRKTIGYWLTEELIEHAPEAYFNLLRIYARR